MVKGSGKEAYKKAKFLIELDQSESDNIINALSLMNDHLKLMTLEIIADAATMPVEKLEEVQAMLEKDYGNSPDKAPPLLIVRLIHAKRMAAEMSKQNEKDKDGH